MNRLNEHDRRALTAMLDAVADKGTTYVYQMVTVTHDEVGDELDQAETLCLYVKDGQPSCLVAHAMIRSKLLRIDILREFEGSSAAALFDGNEDHVRLSGGVSDALNLAQQAQDKSRPWGEAARSALLFLQTRGYEVGNYRARLAALPQVTDQSF